MNIPGSTGIPNKEKVSLRGSLLCNAGVHLWVYSGAVLLVWAIVEIIP